MDTLYTSIYSQLSEFANSDNFWTDFELIFGTQFDQTIAENIRNQWKNGDFSSLPALQIVNSQVLGSANGGYSVDTNTIYLSDSLLNGTPNQIITVLLEEIGHFIDAEINPLDTLGDEGEYFASIIQKQTLSNEDLWRIKNEDDTAQIILNNQTFNIEQNITVTVPEFIFVRTINTIATPLQVEEGTTATGVAAFGANLALVNVTVIAPGFSAFIIQGESTQVSLDPNTNSGTVQIVPSGLVTPKVINLIARDDSIYQGDRNVTVTVKVTSPNDANFSSQGTFTPTITDDESMISIDSNNNLVIEPIVGSNSNDGWIISSDGNNLIISDTNQILDTNITGSSGDATNTITIPLTSFADFQPNSIIVNTLAGNDVLTIDFSKGNPLPDGGITFNGGDDSDSLVLKGGTFTNTTYTYFNENDGNINLDEKVINYNDLEPITSTITSANVILDYSTSTETITITAVDVTQTNVDSTQGETTTFNNPSNSLTINGGATGVNTFNVNSISSEFEADLNINGSGYTNGDVVNINGDFTSNDFSIDLVQKINVASGKGITTNDINDKVDVTWTTGQTIDFASGSSLTTTKGNINLTAKGTATGNYQGIILNGSTITSNEGEIELNGTGGGNGGDQYGLYLLNGSKIISTTTATIKITGQGSLSGLNGGNDGIRMVGANSLISSVSGDIELTGIAGTGSSFNEGVRIADGSQVTTETGTITIQGTTNNNLSGSFNIGIHIYSQSKITSTDTGKISLIGLAINGINDNDGIRIEGTNTLVSAKDGSIDINGTGGGSGNANLGVRITGEGQVKSTGQATVKITGQGSTNGVDTNYGVQVVGGNTAVTSIDGDITIEGTGGGSGGNNRGVSIESGGVISSSGKANITVTGQGSTSGSGNDNDGVRIDGNNSKIKSDTASIEIKGTGGSGQRLNMGVRLFDQSSVSSNSGTIFIEGEGSTSTTQDDNNGVRVDNASITTVNGAINIKGTGGNGTTSNHGVILINNGKIASVDGAINIKGTGGSGTSRSIGVILLNGGAVASTGKATITVTGQASTSSSGNDNDGVRINGSNSTIESNKGSIDIKGTGGGTGDANLGIRITGGGQVKSTGEATINITGQGSTSGVSTNYGVQVVGGNSAITSVDGNITIEGTGGGTGGNNRGVSIESSGVISSSGKANITVTGQGSTSGSGNDNDGVRIDGNNSKIKSDTASIEIKGTGGSGQRLNVGVRLFDQSSVSSNSGTIFIEGEGSTSTTQDDNNGVRVDNASITTVNGAINIKGTGGNGTTSNHGVILINNGKIASVDGAINIKGTGGSGTSSNHGVILLNGGAVASTGKATITVTGQASTSASGNDNDGVRINGSNSRIESEAGSIDIKGTGGGTGDANLGVRITTGGQVKSTGEATINITGQGSTSGGNFNYGVQVTGGNTAVTSVDGNITIEGTGGGSSGTNRGVSIESSGVISSSGKANITVTGKGSTSATGNSNRGVMIDGDGSAITSTGSGNITIDGTGGGKAGESYGVHVVNKGKISSTGTGIIKITSQGSLLGTGTGNYGIRVQGENTLISSVSGSIDIEGKGGTGTGFNSGVLLSDKGAITSATGSITVQGTADGQGGTNIGIAIVSESKIIQTNSGKITLIGQGSKSGTGNGNDGVRIENTNSQITTKNGSISITGTAGTGSQQNRGVLLNNGLITSETGNISVEGTGGHTGISNYGVWLTSGGSITSTGTGGDASQINITGNGAITAIGNIDNDGVRIDGTNSKISSVAGLINITGTAGNGTNGNRGVVVFNNGVVTSETGNITVNGTGSGTGNENYGVYIISNGTNGGVISSTGTGANAATINITGQGSLNSTGSGSQGIRLEGTNSQISSIAGAINLMGRGGSSTNDNYGVLIFNNSGVNTVNGNVSITGIASGKTNENYGVYLLGGGKVSSTGTGTISITGQGSTSATGNNNDGIRLNNSTVQSNDGNIVLTGTGGGTGTTQLGVRIIGGAKIESTGKATINIKGFGGENAVSTNYGVQVTGGSSAITSKDGDITIEGTGRGSGNNNRGVSIENGGTISSTGNGIITVIGLGSTIGTTNSNNGVFVTGTNSTISSNNSNIIVTGTGGGTGADNIGVRVDNSASIKTEGNGTITITGKGSTPSTSNVNNRGILVESSGSITSVNGNITINATGFGNGTGGSSSGSGIDIRTSGLISSTKGNISITATGSSSSSGNNRGVFVLSGGAITTENNGTINVTGNGSSTAGGTGNNGVHIEGTNSRISSVNGNITVNGTAGSGSNVNYGVYLLSAGAIISTGEGNNLANISVLGQSNNAIGNDNDGVRLQNANSRITSKDGAISVTGIGGNGGIQNMGVRSIFGSLIQSTGNGSVTVIGTGGNGTNSNFGVRVFQSTVSSNNGNLIVKGTGGGGGTNNHGVTVESQGVIQSVGKGTVTITGVGSGTSGDGIRIDATNSKIQSATSTIALTGTGSGTGVGINLINSGSILSSSGNITLETDTINLAGGNNSISSSGELVVIQKTDNTSIGLGSESGTLNLTSSEILSFKDGFNKISIGNNKSGSIDIQNATFTDNLNLISGSNIIANGLTVTSANATIISNGIISEGTGTTDADISATNIILSGTVKPGAVANTFGVLNITGNLSFENDAITDILSLEIDGDSIAGTDFDQLSVIGTVNITNVALNFNNSNINSSNISSNEIILINNDSTTDAIIGSLSNYDDGDLVIINDLTYIVDYQGGDGNDLSLNLAESEITIDGNNNLVITDILFTDTNDRWTISFNGTNIIVTDTEGKFITTNIAGATGNNTSEITIPLTSFAGNLPSGIITNTVGGNNIVTLDEFTSAFGGDLNIKGDGYSNDNTITIDTNPNSNDFSIDLVKNIEVKSAITTNDTGDNGDINWTVGESIDFASNGSITTTKGNISLSGKQINLVSGASIVSNTGNITLKADTMSLDGGNDSISSSGELSIIQETDNTSIGLGSATGTLNLTSTEIASFKDGFSTITIGNNKTGAVKIKNATFTDNLTITGSSIDVIALNGGNNNITLNVPTGNITHDNNSSTTDIIANELDLNANAIINTIQIDANTLSAIAQTGDVRVTDTSGGLTVKNASATGGGTIALKAVGGDLNINTVSAQFNIDLIAEDGKITDNNGIGVNNITSATSTAFALSGIDLDVSTTISGYETTGVGDIILRRSSGGIDVGGGGIKTNDGDINISIASGNLRVVSGIIAGGTNTITVDISGNIQDFNADDNNFTGTSAKINTGNGIGTIGNAIETKITNLAARASTSGDIAIKNTGALTIGTVEGLSGVTANNGQVNLSSTDAITVNESINAGGNITLKADTISLDGGVDSISSSVELLITPETDGTSIGLGSGSGTLNLTSSEILSFKDGFSKIIIGNNKSGVIDIQNATFTDNLTLISGSNIIANGLTVTGANATIISNGTISEGTTGSDADITADNVILSGIIKLGGVANTYGVFNINGNLSFDSTDSINDTLEIEIDGDESAVNFDKLVVNGTVNITGVTLDLDLTSLIPSVNTMTYTLIENDGIDTVTGIFNGLAQDTKLASIKGFDFFITYQGGTGNDVQLYLQEVPAKNIRGTTQSENLQGVSDIRNIINADGGNDNVMGANYADTLLGGGGNDTLSGYDGKDYLDGGSSNDRLLGGDDNDILTGGSGNDTLIGGNGNDNLSGGTGRDYFVFNNPNEGIDRITDFTVVDDFIQLSGSGFGLPLGQLNVNTFTIGSSATDGDDRIIYNKNTGGLFYDADGTGIASQVQIATLNSRPSLTNAHIIVI